LKFSLVSFADYLLILMKFNVIRNINKSLYLGFLAVLILGLFHNCSYSSQPANETNPYSFFIAGHTSGYRWVNNKGLHPPFEKKFDLINERKCDFGVLLGDIVFESTDKDWAEVDSVLHYLNCTTYYAVGNHDIVNRQVFEARYGKTYYHFTLNQDLFIVLDPNLDSWNISGEQLVFLKEVLEENANTNRNIFVFFHQLLWWSNDNKYNKIRVNSFDKRADKINFWSEIEPMFNQLPQKVYMFAGDIGAHWAEDFMYDSYDNITFVATGMGSVEGDSFVFINVDENGKVGFELISLIGDDIHELGKLEDYQLP